MVLEDADGLVPWRPFFKHAAQDGVLGFSSSSSFSVYIPQVRVPIACYSIPILDLNGVLAPAMKALYMQRVSIARSITLSIRKRVIWVIWVIY